MTYYLRKGALIYDNHVYDNLFNFVTYIKNFPNLYSENINRLRYYNNNLYDKLHKSNKNFSNIFIDDNIKYIILNLYNEKDFSEDFFKINLFSIFILIHSYKEIVSLLPKKNIFTKNIESKIDNISEFFADNVNPVNTRTIHDISSEVVRVSNLPFFKTLSERQLFRNNYKDKSKEMCLNFN